MCTYLDKSGSGSIKTTLEDAQKDKITNARDFNQSLCKTVVENKHPKQQIRSMLPVVCCVLRQPKHKTRPDRWIIGRGAACIICVGSRHLEIIKIYRPRSKPPWLWIRFFLQRIFLRSDVSAPCQDVYMFDLRHWRLKTFESLTGGIASESHMQESSNVWRVQAAAKAFALATTGVRQTELQNSKNLVAGRAAEICNYYQNC